MTAAERTREWRRRNPEKQAKHAERSREYTKIWLIDHKEEVAASNKDYREKNREHLTEERRRRQPSQRDYCAAKEWLRKMGLGMRDVPRELVSMIEMNIRLKRKIRRLENGKESESTS